MLAMMRIVVINAVLKYFPLNLEYGHHTTVVISLVSTEVLNGRMCQDFQEEMVL